MFKKLEKNNAFTVMELLVSSVILLSIISGMMVFYSNSISYSHDLRVKESTDSQVRALVGLLGLDLRMIGNGVPFEQPNFQIGDITLSDPLVTEPVEISSATSTYIKFRMNESGDTFMLTQNFDPSTDSEVNIFLNSGSTFSVGDTVYITNSTIAEDDGFYGVLSGVDLANSRLTFDASTCVYSSGAVFNTSSILEKVDTISLESLSDGSGVTRRVNDNPAVILSPNSTFSIEYVDLDNNVMTLPLSIDSLTSELSAIRISVSVSSSSQAMKILAPGGGNYVSSSTYTFALRNLNFNN